MISGGFPIPMPRRSRVAPMHEPTDGNIPPQTPKLPPQLEARIGAFERAAPAPEFDAASWFWMMLLGVAVPLLLLAVGWWA
jgi:hypothetical protein